MTDTDKLAEPSPKAGGELAEALEDRIDDVRAARDSQEDDGPDLYRLGRFVVTHREAILARLRTPEQPDRNAVLEEAAKVATGFLVGDPTNGLPLRNPMPHEIATAIRALKEPTA